MLKHLFVAVLILIFLAPLPEAAGQAPSAPVLVAPANGASAAQPITLRWQPINDPDGPIGSYSWQVSTSSTFTSVIASGFQNLSHPDIPIPTDGQVSGLANGTYFWRVKGAQDIGPPTGYIDSSTTSRTSTASSAS